MLVRLPLPRPMPSKAFVGASRPLPMFLPLCYWLDKLELLHIALANLFAALQGKFLPITDRSLARAFCRGSIFTFQTAIEQRFDRGCDSYFPFRSPVFCLVAIFFWSNSGGGAAIAPEPSFLICSCFSQT